MNPQIRKMPPQPVNTSQVGSKSVLYDYILAHTGQFGGIEKGLDFGRNEVFGGCQLQPIFDGHDPADDQNILLGMDRDVNGFTGTGTDNNDNEVIRPYQDRPGLLLTGYEFGSAHPGVFNIVHCDGSAASISFDIDDQTFYVLGGRNDGDRDINFAN